MGFDHPGGGGGLPYETDGDASPQSRIKPLKETNLGWLRRYLTPKGDHTKTDNQIRATVILIALKTNAKD